MTAASWTAGHTTWRATTNAVCITLAVPLVLTNETKVELDFDLATVLNAPHALSFGRDGSSMHSRDGDPISAALVKNLTGAFRVHRISALTATEIAVAHPKPLYLPETFTPYEFKMSATFPVPDLPRDNPLTVERVDLGKKLFFDKHVSVNDRQSCADCHVPDKAFTDGRRTARGAEGDLGKRNSMPLFNLAWKREFFWDGRAKSLREQVLQPIQNPVEMHQSLTNLVRKLNTSVESDQSYPAMFAAAFGSPEITAEKIALALENYLLTLTSFDAKFDRVLSGSEKFTDEEQRGFELFSTEYDPRRGQFGADCFHCHGGLVVPEPGVRQQRFGRRAAGYRTRKGHWQDIGSGQIRRAVAAQYRAHRALYARWTVPYLGRCGGALFHRRAAPRPDLGPQSGQAPRRRRAVEHRG